MKIFPIKLKNLVYALAFTAALNISAANDVKTINQVTAPVIITEAIDYHITDKSPFTSQGSIDIQNPDAAVVFVNIRPSVVNQSYLKYITVNGIALQNNVNCRVSIYKQGTIILPHSDTKNPDGTPFYPLTVYTGDNCTGEATNYNGGTRKTNANSFEFRSFTLKRGYMVTMANNIDGTGYSHCYIANTEDRTIQLRKELADKVGFFRIFRWQWPSKKGSCDVGANELNATWHYNWGAGRSSDINYEYVPQRHHEAGIQNDGDNEGAWESWTNINASDETCVHVLGQNEPDNTSGGNEVTTYVTTIAHDTKGNGTGAYTSLVDHAHEFLYSGKRIGTFATCNPNTSWVSEYVNWCRANNIRVDFVATHYYIGGTDPKGCIDRLKALYNATGLPVWVTEWNNGANWTTESGFNTDSEGWHSWINKDQYNATDSRKNGVWLTDVLKRADKEPWLERLAVYSAVQYNRQVNYNGTLSECGKLYAAYNSDFAFSDGNEYFMTWSHKAPGNLSIEFKKAQKRAILRWTHNNSKQTDSVHVERKIDGVDKDFVNICTMTPTSSKDMTYNYDDLEGLTGMISYRVRNFDSDGRQRTTDEVSVTIGSSTGNETIQYGKLTISNTEEVTTEFSQEFAEVPAVFMGVMTNANAEMYPNNLINTLTKTKFGYKIFPWEFSGDQTLEKDEDISFAAMALGNYKYGNMEIEVDSVKVKGDTLLVEFIKPFPEGVTPVVITELKPLLKGSPMMTKIWDVTNTGFKATVMYEAGKEAPIRTNQPLFYLAVTPGSENIGDGIQLSAGFGENPVYGSTYKIQTFTRTNEGGALDTLKLKNPHIFGALQTYNVKAGTILRNVRSTTVKDEEGYEYTTGIRLKRIIDKSSSEKDNKSSADNFGWFTISEATDSEVSVENITIGNDRDALQVKVINGRIYTEGNVPFDTYTLSGVKVSSFAKQEPGIYIVRSGGKSVKISIR